KNNAQSTKHKEHCPPADKKTDFMNRHYLRLIRSLITKYIDKKTERIVNTTVNTGNSKATTSSSLIPPNTPTKIIAIIWNAIVEYFV
ncbi:unnamed protein product, partial [marine sediment metagenome]